MRWFRKHVSSMGSAHWSADYVEHLRSIHFALIVICITALLFATSRTSSTEDADHQLGKLMHWLESKELSNKLAEIENDRILAKLGVNRVAVEVPRSIWVLIPRQNRCSESFFVFETFDEVLRDLSVNSFAGRLERDWDTLICSSTVIENVTGFGPELVDEKISETGLLDPGTIRKVDITFDRADTAQKLKDQGYKIIRAKIVSKRAINLAGISSQNKDSWPLEAADESTNSKLGFSVHLTPDENRRWTPLIDLESVGCIGTFYDCFPELTDVIATRKDYSLTDLKAFLERRMKDTSGSEKIEVLGLKFTVETEWRWGIALILVILSYFWIHLRELANFIRPDDAGTEVAWIGLSSHWYARVMIELSVVVLPVFAIFRLGFASMEPLIMRNASSQEIIVTTIFFSCPLILAVFLTLNIQKKISQLSKIAQTSRSAVRTDPIGDC